MSFYTNRRSIVLRGVGLLLGYALLGFPSPCQAQHVESHPSAASPESPEGLALSFPAMGTQVELTAYGPASDVQPAFERARARVHALAAVLTDYDPASETRRLTKAASEGSVAVSDELWRALAASDDWYRRSQGAFDASLGNLTRLWRKHRRAERLPDSTDIADALAATGWQFVHLDKLNRQVRFDHPEIQLDFGAIGKGLIVDAAFEILVAEGLDHCLVNISGNMRCGLPPPGRAGWKIEVAALEPRGEPLWRMELSQRAIATSGDLWQFVVVDGVRRSHILDPSTGMGVPGPISATVISHTATDADACATAACVLAGRQRSDLLIELSEAHPMLIATRPSPDDSPELQTLGDFPRRFGAGGGN